MLINAQAWQRNILHLLTHDQLGSEEKPQTCEWSKKKKKSLEYILRLEYSSSYLQQRPASWVWTAARDALWYLRSRDAGDQTARKAQHLSLSVTPSGETSAERLAAGKRSHDRVKMSRLISDYSAFLWRSSTSLLLQLHSQPVISASPHQRGICHWIQEWRRGWVGEKGVCWFLPFSKDTFQLWNWLRSRLFHALHRKLTKPPPPWPDQTFSDEAGDPWLQPPRAQTASGNVAVTPCPSASGKAIPSCNVPPSQQLMSHPSVHQLQTLASCMMACDLKAWLVTPN